MRTYRDIYPTGRKHCSLCKRWRHVLDFSVKQWTDHMHEIPLTLQSRCHSCMALTQRAGAPRRDWYINGAPGSKKRHEHVLTLNRASAKRRRRRKAYRELEREYWRIWSNAKRAEAKRRTREQTDDMEVIMELNNA